MITLYEYYRAWGLPNASPFCMKLETYLRMAKLPYENKFVNNPQKSPKQKFPYIKMDGTLYADSELIIAELKDLFANELDSNLTAEQRALAVLIEATCCERLYWFMVYLRWQNDAGWVHLKGEFFGKLPAVLKLFVPNLVRKGVIKQLHNQGTGRHTKAEIIQLGIKTIDALSTILGEQKYFLGDKPSSIDATGFAFLANLIYPPVQSPLKQHALGLANLIAYCNRMWADYYPELPIPQL